MNNNDKMIITISFLFLFVLTLIGCFDRNGFNSCYNSYDNLILEDGYKILAHTSDFVSGAENRYFVFYYIKGENESVWLHGFIYDSKYDELIWVEDDDKLPNYVIDYH